LPSFTPSLPQSGKHFFKASYNITDTIHPPSFEPAMTTPLSKDAPSTAPLPVSVQNLNSYYLMDIPNYTSPILAETTTGTYILNIADRKWDDRKLSAEDLSYLRAGNPDIDEHDDDNGMNSILCSSDPPINCAVMTSTSYKALKGGVWSKQPKQMILVVSKLGGFCWVEGSSKLGRYHVKRLKKSKMLGEYQLEQDGSFKATFSIWGGDGLPLSTYTPDRRGAQGRINKTGEASKWRSSLGFSDSTAPAVQLELPPIVSSLPPLSASTNGTPAMVLGSTSRLALEFNSAGGSTNGAPSFKPYAL
jgi:hypothetical protein